MYLLYKQHRNLAFFFVISCFIIYGNSLKNKYALDDEYVTVTNSPVSGQNYVPNHKQTSKGFKGIPEIWASNYAHDSESSFEYRPFTTTTFAIEYQFFGQSPFISHLINLIIYIITIWCIFCVLMLLFRDMDYKFSISFLTAFIFLIHPAHTETLNNIKCRDELMALLFPLIALWYSLKCFDKPSFKEFAFIALCLLLGLFSKKSALLFMAIIPVCLIFYRNLTRKTIILFFISLFVTRFLYYVIKTSFLEENEVRLFYHFENPLFTENVSFFARGIVALKTLGFYIKFLLFPYPFRFYYGVNSFSTDGSINLYAVLAVLFIAGGFIYYFKSKNKLFLFSFFLFLGSIFPFMNFAAPIAGIVGERLLYQSSLWFCLIIISVSYTYLPKVNAFKLNFLTAKPLVYTIPLMIVCTLLIWNRNSQWYNKMTLFEHDMPYLTESAKANSLMGNEYFEAMRDQAPKHPVTTLANKALEHYSLAVKNDSSIYTAYNNAGVVYFSYLGSLDKAEASFRLAIRHKIDYPQAYENLGNVQKQRQLYDSAILYYKKALFYNAKQYNSAFEITNCLIAQKKYAGCFSFCDTYLTLFPNDYTFLLQKANCLFFMNKKEEAVSMYESAYRVNPNDALRTYINSLSGSPAK